MSRWSPKGALSNLTIPLIQGGMGVAVSEGNLAGAVAAEGAMGTLSFCQVGYREPDFRTRPLAANLRAFDAELENARAIAKVKGMIAVNIMHALTDYAAFAKHAANRGIDAIVVGAGLPTDLPKYVEGTSTAIAPIVSGARALQLLLRVWEKKFERYPDFVVLEGRDAGGHLGFAPEEMDDEAHALPVLIREVVAALTPWRKKTGRDIPLFVGGGIFDAEDVRMAIENGADGVQVGTRFIATAACDASAGFKEKLLRSKESDVRRIVSPVGMPARALQSPLLDRIKAERVPPIRCTNCLKTCDPRTTPYCITDALIAAVRGDEENGLFFSGQNVGRINEMQSVSDIVDEWKEALL